MNAKLGDRRERATVYWLDKAGKGKPYRTLPPGEAFTQSTFVGHAWLVADPSTFTCRTCS